MKNIAKVFSLLVFVQCKLKVTFPNSLASKFEFNSSTGQIAFDMGNFGHYPYGRVMEARTFIPQQAEGFYDGCREFNRSYSEINGFMIVYRGNCSFVQKARQIQLYGGIMAIIIDDKDTVDNGFVMANDGMGFQITIPTIFIGRIDGQNLIDYIQQQKDFQDMPLLKIHFKVNRREKSQIDFGLSFLDRSSFILIRSMINEIYYMIFDKTTDVNFYYQVYTCQECKQTNYTSDLPNCLGGGRYCSEDPEHESLIGTGRNVLEEMIRQVCILQQMPSYYIRYITAFDLECLHPSSYQICGDIILNKLANMFNIFSRLNLQMCVSDSYKQDTDSKDQAKYLQTNSILEEQIKFKLYSGLNAYPGVVINGQPYLGNLEGEYIMEEICDSYKLKMAACETKNFEIPNLDEETTYETDNNGWKIIGIVLLVVICCSILMILIYQKIIERDTKKQTSGQVTKLVEQYIEFYEDKSKQGFRQN